MAGEGGPLLAYRVSQDLEKQKTGVKLGFYKIDLIAFCIICGTRRAVMLFVGAPCFINAVANG